MTYPRHNHACGTYMTRAGLELMVIRGIDESLGSPPQTSESFNFENSIWTLGTIHCPIEKFGTGIQFGLAFMVVGGKQYMCTIAQFISKILFQVI